MNKRQRKKYAKKCYYKTYSNPKLHPTTYSDLIKLCYRNPYNTFEKIIEKLIYSQNPILNLYPQGQNMFNKPVILGLEHGVTFS